MPRKALPGKANSAPRVRMAPAPRRRPRKARLTAPPRPTTLAGMTLPEPGVLAVLAEYVLRAGPTIAAAGIWFFGFHMMRGNTRRADAEQNRHTEAMTALAQAAEDRKAMQAQAAEDRKVTQGILAALQELIRRTSPPSSQAGPQPGPAE